MKAKPETVVCPKCFKEYDPEEEEDGVAYGDTCPWCNHIEGEKNKEDNEEDWEKRLETLRKTVKHLHGRMDETERRLSCLEHLEKR